MLMTILHSAAAHGALSGWLGAAAVDVQAFRSWKTVHDAAAYQWGTAVWRWFQGAVIGAVSGAGYGALLG